MSTHDYKTRGKKKLSRIKTLLDTNIPDKQILKGMQRRDLTATAGTAGKIRKQKKGYTQ